MRGGRRRQAAGRAGVRWALGCVLGLALTVPELSSIASASSPAWIAAASTIRAHTWASAAAGPDGRIYIFGNDTVTPNGRVEVYTPSANTWAAGAPMPTARARTAAVLASNGRIYVLGGYVWRGGVKRKAEAYAPRTNTWSTAAPMPIGGEQIAAAAGPDGKIYVFGGHRNRFGADGHGDLDTVQIYDPSSDSWSVEHSMPVALMGAAAVMGSDGRIYVMGGWNGTLASPENRVWAYDTRTGRFSDVASMTQARETFGAAAGPNGTIYVVGGHTSAGSSSGVEVYSIAGNSWTDGPPLPAAESALSVAESGGVIYAIDGTGPHTDFIHGTKSVWALRPSK